MRALSIFILYCFILGYYWQLDLFPDFPTPPCLRLRFSSLHFKLILYLDVNPHPQIVGRQLNHFILEETHIFVCCFIGLIMVFRTNEVHLKTSIFGQIDFHFKLILVFIQIQRNIDKVFIRANLFKKVILFVRIFSIIV